MLKKFVNEFREFIEKGNAFDMAVGVITGATLTGVVNSLVRDIMMPPIGLFLGRVDFGELFIILYDPNAHDIIDGIIHQNHYHTIAAANAAGVTTMNIGLFINALVSFLITMFAVFMLLRFVNRARRRTAAPPVPTRTCPLCFVDKVDARATVCPACCNKIVPDKIDI